jgi:hypothetical protein
VHATSLVVRWEKEIVSSHEKRAKPHEATYASKVALACGVIRSIRMAARRRACPGFDNKACGCTMWHARRAMRMIPTADSDGSSPEHAFDTRKPRSAVSGTVSPTLVSYSSAGRARFRPASVQHMA